MTEWIRFWITAVLLIIGLISFAAAVIGNYRFGYILNRVHAGGIGDTQGLFFIVLALIVSCNAALDISKDPGACLRLCKKIYEREALRYEGEIKKTK